MADNAADAPPRAAPPAAPAPPPAASPDPPPTAPPAAPAAGKPNHNPAQAQEETGGLPEFGWNCCLILVIFIVSISSIAALVLHLTGHSNILPILGHSSQHDSEHSTLGGGPIFYVESISSFKVSDSQITSNWDIAIRVANNGTSELHYDKVQVYVRYKGQLLSQTAVGPINVAPEEYTTLQARLGASHNIDNQVTASIIKDKTQEAVDFNVELKVTYKRISGRKYIQDGKSTGVDCGDIKVEFSADTNTWTMLGGPSTCKVQV